MHDPSLCSDAPPEPDSLTVHLPTEFDPRIGKILVTGASGYIGGRLTPVLIERGYQVRAMVRTYSPEYPKRWPGAEIAVADALDNNPGPIHHALDRIDTAYYLIHSLYLGPKEFEAAEITAASNFARAARRQGIRRIIYLGGLGDGRDPLSPHLRSRMEVAEELKRGGIPVTILRAGIIIGSGSASYEIIQYLVRRIRLMPIPYWAKNRCQPISLRDVVKYLVGVLEVPKAAGRNFDIGGRDVLTYEDMLRVLGDVIHKRVVLFRSPFSNLRFFAYAASLITPVPGPITQCLMEGLQNEVVCKENSIRDEVPFEPIGYREAIVRAMTREEQDKVYTRWSDAYPPAHDLALKLHELQTGPRYTTLSSRISAKSAHALFESFNRVGGKQGWFHNNWLWRLRGMIDRIMGGVGTSRGRRSYGDLNINDVIDFWRIEDIQQDRRLLLRAEMILPGKAWLEFNIRDNGTSRSIFLTAFFDTQSAAGKLYWYSCLPFHHLIFTKLLGDIEKRA